MTVKNKKGATLSLVLVVSAVVGVFSITIMNLGEQTQKVSRQLDASLAADLVKQKLVGAVLSPASWQATQNHNTTAFSSFDPNHPPLINIYTTDTNTPFYESANTNSGFDPKGNSCSGFDASSGSDACPFHYNLTLKSRVQVNGNWIDTIHFELKYKPVSSGPILNVRSQKFTFDLVRNLNDRSVESSCILLSGAYDTDSNQCSEKVTKPVTLCPGGYTYRGPGSNNGNNHCDEFTLTPKSCPSTQVIKGFSTSGSPQCGAPI